MIRLRAMAKRQGRKGLTLGLLLLVSLILAWAHGAPGDHEMADGEMGSAITVCLAVLQGGAAMLLGAVGFARSSHRRSAHSVASVHADFNRFKPPGDCIRSRAGPPLLQVFLR